MIIVEFIISRLQASLVSSCTLEVYLSHLKKPKKPGWPSKLVVACLQIAKTQVKKSLWPVVFLYEMGNYFIYHNIDIKKCQLQEGWKFLPKCQKG